MTTIEATREEQQRAMPGDVLVPNPMFTATHAITIDVPPECVWPWLSQMGSLRGGWYTYDRIDNDWRPSADRILHEYQQLAPGDVLPCLPGATDAFVVEVVKPPFDLILTVPAAKGPVTSWEHLVEPIEPGCSRLIVRGQVAHGWKLMARDAHTDGQQFVFIEYVYRCLGRLPDSLLIEIAGFGHRFMEARHLRGIKRRAEASNRTAQLAAASDAAGCVAVAEPHAIAKLGYCLGSVAAMKIYILLAHPDKDSLNGAFADSYEAAAREAGHDVRRQNIGDMSFDPVLWKGYKQIQELEPDLKQAQINITWCQHWVILYPIWWGSVPAIFKGFIDRTLYSGFAYRYHDDDPLWDKLLKGRSAQIFTTSDAPWFWIYFQYRNCDVNAIKRATLQFCGVNPVKVVRFSRVRSSAKKRTKVWFKTVRNSVPKLE